MRILSINNSSDIYGASRCLERVFTRLASAGHEVFVVLPDDGPLVSLLQRGGVHVLLHPGLAVVDRRTMCSARGISRFLLRWPCSVLWLAMVIVSNRIDLVHTNTAVMPSPAVAAWLTRTPHVWHVREFFGEFGPLWKLYQNYLCLLSTTVVAISASVAGQFSKRYRDKIAIIYDGLPSPCEVSERLSDRPASPACQEDISIRERFAIAEAVLIGVIGRIKWVRKGQEIAIEAFARVKDKYPDTRLVVVGSPADGNEAHLQRLTELCVELGVASRVTFTGEFEVTARTYAAMDITVVPSVQPEPFGCVVMESMAAGTPVVGSSNGGIPEQIVDNESGLLFSPGDASQLAACLDHLLCDEALRRRIGEAGRARVLSHFSIDRTVSSTEKVFERARGLHPLESILARESGTR